MSNDYTPCCFAGFEWNGTPKGAEGKLAGLDTYMNGSDTKAAVLVIHDAFGWTFTNERLLCDHYAAETPATVYMPNFFGGEGVDPAILKKGPPFPPSFSFADLREKNNKEKRWPEDTRLRASTAVGVIGYCFGGWSSFRLGAASLNAADEPLVDCISTAHPTMLTREEIDEIGVPVQIVEPEHDTAFNPDLKVYALSKIPTKGVPFDYQYFPGLEHAFATRGDEKNERELRGMTRAKRAQVAWMSERLHGEKAW